MAPALRKRPRALACAAPTLAPASLCPDALHGTPASVKRRPNVVARGGR